MQHITTAAQKNMIVNIFFALILALTYAHPLENKVGAQNVATVPPNCLVGFQWINGKCREIMPNMEESSIDINNIITVPPNCPPGFEWINGACREVWFRVTVPPNDWHRNVVTVPPNCPPGQQWINGKCRDVWNRNCGPGQAWVNESCRDIFGRRVVEAPENWQPNNIVTVPPNCPPGQEWINGKCTEVWRRNDEIENVQCAFGKVINGQCVTIKELLSNAINRSQSKREIPDHEVALIDGVNKMDGKDASRKIVNIPNQCPAGYKPDSNGICREMWF